MLSWWKKRGAAPPAAAAPPASAPSPPPVAAGDAAAQAWADGFAHHQAGRLAEAAQRYEQVLAAQPGHFHARHLLGVIALQEGRLPQAVQHISAALRIDPRQAAAHNNLGTSLLRAGRFDEARSAFQNALALDPKDAAASANLAAALERLGLQRIERGELGPARQALEEAVRHQPGRASAHANLGALLRDTGHLPAARVALRQALALNPQLFEARLNAALVALETGDAADADATLAALVLDHPGSAEAHATQGRARLAQGRLDEAEAALRRAIELDNSLAQAHHALGLVRMARGDAAGARTCHERASALDPADGAARWAAVMARLPALLEREEDAAASRDAFAAGLRELDRWFDAQRAGKGHLAVGSTQPFYLAYQGGNHKDLLAPYGRLCERLMGAWPGRPPRLAALPVTGRAIRVGIVSAQVRDHSVWTAILRGWVEHLDRSRFETHVFSLGAAADAQTQVARELAGHFHAGPAGLNDWVARILAAAPDVLLYPEVGMDAMTVKLASLRLAPLQLATWGHPLTTGLPTLDAFVSAEAFEPPGAADHYGEALVALPGLGVCYEPLAVEPERFERAAFGLPPVAPLLLCPGLPQKYGPAGDALWAQIAQRVPQARLVFFEAGPEGLHQQLKLRLQRAFAARGLEIEDHVAWLPALGRPLFFGLMHEASLFLDPVGFSGFNTVMQAVECALPVVALEGEALRGRFGSGVLREIGLPDCVATSHQGYADLVVALVRDGARHEAVRAHLAEHAHRLFSTRAPVRALEDFLARRLGVGP